MTEEERAKARRIRDEERVSRFYNSKLRTIGVDAAFLDQQIKERRNMEKVAREEEAEDAAYQASLIQHLEEAEAAEQSAKDREIQDVKRTLLQQMATKNNAADRMGDPLVLDASGPSSAQCFGGEDEANKERTKLQQEQVRYI